MLSSLDFHTALSYLPEHRRNPAVVSLHLALSSSWKFVSDRRRKGTILPRISSLLSKGTLAQTGLRFPAIPLSFHVVLHPTQSYDVRIDPFYALSVLVLRTIHPCELCDQATARLEGRNMFPCFDIEGTTNGETSTAGY